MLSDEEKKSLKDCDTIFICLEDMMSEESANDYRKSYQTLKNLIENQQKEIEELKSQIDEHVYYSFGGRSNGKTELLRHYKKGYDMCNKFWKDKIKALIEERKEKIKKLHPASDCVIIDELETEINVLEELL